MYAIQTMKGERTPKVGIFSNRKFCVLRLSDWFFKIKSQVDDQQEVEVFRFEISTEKLSALLLSHQICAADIRCLDTRSKQCLKALCLKTCLHNT